MFRRPDGEVEEYDERKDVSNLVGVKVARTSLGNNTATIWGLRILARHAERLGANIPQNVRDER